MSQFLQEAKHFLSQSLFRQADEELHLLEQYLAQAGAEKLPLVQWVYQEGTGFVDPRAKAGMMFFEEDPETFWNVTERLIHSAKPDDRDTAITTLQDIDDPRKFDLIKPLLDDPYFYIQSEAIEQLKDIFREEVLERLRTLSAHANHHYSAWAKEILKKLGHG